MYDDAGSRTAVIASMVAAGFFMFALTVATLPMMFVLTLFGDNISGGGGMNMIVADGTMPVGAVKNFEERLLWPLVGYGPDKITSGFGVRNTGIAGASTNHMGIDIGAPELTPVYAAGSGNVIRSSYNSARGNYIEIDHGNGVSTLYQHLNTRGCDVGDEILQGQYIGLVGHTGVGSGAHLHFEVKVNGICRDPMTIFQGE